MILLYVSHRRAVSLFQQQHTGILLRWKYYKTGGDEEEEEEKKENRQTHAHSRTQDHHHNHYPHRCRCMETAACYCNDYSDTNNDDEWDAEKRFVYSQLKNCVYLVVADVRTSESFPLKHKCKWTMRSRVIFYYTQKIGNRTPNSKCNWVWFWYSRPRGRSNHRKVDNSDIYTDCRLK